MGDEAFDIFVKESKIFTLLDEEGRARLARIAEEVEFPAGTVILREGEEGDSVFCLVSGEVEVVASDFAESERHVATLSSGSLFGEISALSGEPRTATVTAQTEVKMLRMEMVAVFAVLKDYPNVLAELRRLGIRRSEDLLQTMIEE